MILESLLVATDDFQAFTVSCQNSDNFNGIAQHLKFDIYQRFLDNLKMLPAVYMQIECAGAALEERRLNNASYETAEEHPSSSDDEVAWPISLTRKPSYALYCGRLFCSNILVKRQQRLCPTCCRKIRAQGRHIYL